jgi:hypothetical protein
MSMLDRFYGIPDWLATPEGQAEVTLAIAALCGGVFYLCHIMRFGKCDTRKVFSLIFNVSGLAGGVFILFGAFLQMKHSVQNGLWGGIAGAWLIIWTFESIRKEVKSLTRVKEVTPKKRTLVSEKAEP